MANKIKTYNIRTENQAVRGINNDKRLTTNDEYNHFDQSYEPSGKYIFAVAHGLFAIGKILLTNSTNSNH